MTNVRSYTDKELLDRMKSLPDFTHMPKGHHWIDIRSNEDAPNRYDDKKYHFFGEKFLDVMSCTTNSGTYGLKNFRKWNKLGTAVIKSNQICYDSFMKSDGFRVRHHNGKMKCFRQIKDILYYRDGNGDNKIDQVGKIYKANYSTNVHTNSYKTFSGIITWLIGKWGTGCIVVNMITKYYKMYNRIPFNTPITLTILEEF